MDTEANASEPPSALGAESARRRFSPNLPIELWSAILKPLIAPLTQFVSSPTAASAACPQETYFARRTLIRFSHVNKSTHAAARPHLYGTLSIALREKPEHNVFSYPKLPRAGGTFDHRNNAAWHGNQTYLVEREQLAVVGRVFPGWCRAGKACSEAHLDRDQRIAQVTEVPEVFPFVVLGGKLYLASLAANGSGAETQATTEECRVGAIRRSAASLLLGPEGTESIDVRIVNGLVLVQYPLHLVTALHLRTGSVDPSYWLDTGNEDAKRPGLYYDWNLKLPFIFDIPSRQLCSLMLSTDAEVDNTFCEITGQLFNAFPRISTLDVLTNSSRYNYPFRFPSNLQNAFLFQLGRAWDWNVLPTALGCRRVRRVEIYGEHHWIHEDSALQELTIFPAFSGEYEQLGHPNLDSQVPAIPFGRLAKSLRKFTVPAMEYEIYLWTHIDRKILADLLALPLLVSLHLPNVHPSFDPPFTAAGASITCAQLATLEINLNLFLSLFPRVEFPMLSSLTLVGDYTPADEHQFTSVLWIQIASSSFGPQLTHFAFRRIPIDTDYAWPFAFPPNSPVLPRLEAIGLFTSIGHIDVTHLPTIAPRLRSACFDVDHLAGLDAVLAHPMLKSLTLAGLRCPTAFEQLLAHQLPACLKLNVRYRELRGLFGGARTIVGNADLHVCTRNDLVLVYDRQSNRRTWRNLAVSEFDSMPRGQIRAVTAVVPGDLKERERRRVLLTLKHVMRAWEGIKVKVGVLGGVEGQSEANEKPEGVELLLTTGLRKLGHGTIVGEIEWMGKWEGAAGVGTRCCAESEV